MYQKEDCTEYGEKLTELFSKQCNTRSDCSHGLKYTRLNRCKEPRERNDQYQSVYVHVDYQCVPSKLLAVS